MLKKKKKKPIIIAMIKNEKWKVFCKNKNFQNQLDFFPFTDSSWIEQEGNLGSNLGRNTTEIIKYYPSAL